MISLKDYKINDEWKSLLNPQYIIRVEYNVEYVRIVMTDDILTFAFDSSDEVMDFIFFLSERIQKQLEGRKIK